MTPRAAIRHLVAANGDEGEVVVGRPLVNPIGAPPAPVTGRAGLPQILEARPVHSIAETHLGELPC